MGPATRPAPLHRWPAGCTQSGRGPMHSTDTERSASRSRVERRKVSLAASISVFVDDWSGRESRVLDRLPTGLFLSKAFFLLVVLQRRHPLHGGTVRLQGDSAGGVERAQHQPLGESRNSASCPPSAEARVLLIDRRAPFPICSRPSGWRSASGASRAW